MSVKLTSGLRDVDPIFRFTPASLRKKPSRASPSVLSSSGFNFSLYTDPPFLHSPSARPERVRRVSPFRYKCSGSIPNRAVISSGSNSSAKKPQRQRICSFVRHVHSAKQPHLPSELAHQVRTTLPCIGRHCVTRTHNLFRCYLRQVLIPTFVMALLRPHCIGRRVTTTVKASSHSCWMPAPIRWHAIFSEIPPT